MHFFFVVAIIVHKCCTVNVFLSKKGKMCRNEGAAALLSNGGRHSVSSREGEKKDSGAMAAGKKGERRKE